MDFQLTEEQLMVQRTAREAAERILAPGAADRDAAVRFPRAELRELAALGLLGVAIPDEYGGAGADVVAYSLAMQELAKVDASVAVAVSVTNMVGDLIVNAGSEAQKRAHLPRLTSGEAVCAAFALSEPQAGSDPASIATRAERIAGGWRLSGTKQWITSGGHAGLYVLWAQADPAQGRKGLAAFLVPGDAKGLSVGRYEQKLGLHGSTTAQIVLDGVEVGDDDVLAGVGAGFKLAMMALDGGRIGIASQAVGIARGALEAAITYARDRVQFGVPIIKHQAIASMLADAATWLDAAQLLTLRAAYRKGTQQAYNQEASMAKLFATEHAGRICDIALQVHGGYGYTRDFPVERAYRDVRVTRIYEGTSEIQRIVISRNLLGRGGA